MRVRELIKELIDFPMDYEVKYYLNKIWERNPIVLSGGIEDVEIDEDSEEIILNLTT